MMAYRYVPTDKMWIINSEVILWLAIMTWKYITLLRGKEWK